MSAYDPKRTLMALAAYPNRSQSRELRRTGKIVDASGPGYDGKLLRQAGFAQAIDALAEWRQLAA